MNEPMSEQFDEVLLDVRKAFRLLYLYQRRVLDLMKFIGDNFSFRYAGGWSWFSDSSPKDGKGNLESWAWDWLNMYHYEFNFGDKNIDNNNIRFSVHLISDTGYYDSGGEDEQDLNSFGQIEISDTKLLFMIGKNVWHDDFASVDSNFKRDATENVYSSEKGLLLIKSFPLKRFINGDKTLECLREFNLFCSTNDITEIILFR